MAKRRLQVTVSGLVLDYLEYRGRNARVRPEEWPVRGLWHVLDDALDGDGSDYAVWRRAREAEAGLLDD